MQSTHFITLIRVKSHQQSSRPVCSETNASLVIISAKSTNLSQNQDLREKNAISPVN